VRNPCPANWNPSVFRLLRSLATPVVGISAGASRELDSSPLFFPPIPRNFNFNPHVTSTLFEPNSRPSSPQPFPPRKRSFSSCKINHWSCPTSPSASSSSRILLVTRHHAHSPRRYESPILRHHKLCEFILFTPAYAQFFLQRGPSLFFPLSMFFLLNSVLSFMSPRIRIRSHIYFMHFPPLFFPSIISPGPVRSSHLSGITR